MKNNKHRSSLLFVPLFLLSFNLTSFAQNPSVVNIKPLQNITNNLPSALVHKDYHKKKGKYISPKQKNQKSFQDKNKKRRNSLASKKDYLKKINHKKERNKLAGKKINKKN